MQPVPLHEPARSVWARGRAWLAPGFIAGLLLPGQPYLAEIGRHVVSGLMLMAVVYLVACAGLAVVKPRDRGPGGFGALALRTVACLAGAGLVGIAMAVIIPHIAGTPVQQVPPWQMNWEKPKQ